MRAEPFDFIADEFSKASVRHLLVGGYAVNLLAKARTTEDVDIFIAERDLPKARAILEDHGYEVYQKNENFLRFRHVKGTAADIDLLLGADETIDGLIQEGVRAEIHGKPYIVPSPKYLIAMKLHALKTNFALRFSKDLDDIISVARENGIDLKGDTFKDICTRYGDEEVYSAIMKLVDRP